MNAPEMPEMPDLSLAERAAAATFGPNGGAKQAPAPSAREIELRFTYHAPSELQAVRYELLRSKFRALAHEIVALTPASREQSDSLTHLEHSMFAASAAIARREA